MLKVGIIGIGNTGNQIATLAMKRLNIPVIAVNSSEKDLETVPDAVPNRLSEMTMEFHRVLEKIVVLPNLI